MSPDEPTRPVPVVLRIKLRYEDVDTMVLRFAPNVGKAGLFLPTKAIQPIGTEVKFELRLANDTAVIVGLGRVKVARLPDPANPKATFGIGIELMRVTRESRDLILRMLERRRELGLVEVAVPTPDEIDAARRDLDTGVKEAPLPPPAPPEPPQLFTSPRRPSGSFPPATRPPPVAPVIVTGSPVSSLAHTDASPVSAPATSLGAPRPPASASSLSKAQPDIVVKPVTPPLAKKPSDTGVVPLAPEPSKRHVRKSVGELLASVTAAAAKPMTGDMFGSGDEVDVKSVLARARALAAGTDLDAELEALREVAAAPLVEISIEAASAELARQLGGTAIDRKNRSARWAMPPPSAPAPAITEIDPPKEDEPIATGRPPTVPPTMTELAAITSPHKSAAALVFAALVPERVAEKAAAVEAAIEAMPVDDESVAQAADSRAGYIRDDEPEIDPQIPTTAELITEPRRDALVDPDPISQADNPPSQMLIDDNVDPARFDTNPPVELDPALEQQLDQPLEAHAEFDLDAAEERTQFGVQSPIVDPEAFDGHSYLTEPGGAKTSGPIDALTQSLDAQPSHPDEANEDFGFGDVAAHEVPEEVEEVADEAIEEIDDFEILAEADVDEADLVLTDLRSGTSDDFVSRLELTNEFSATPDESMLDDPLAGFRDSVASFSDHAPAYQAPDPLAGFSDEPSVESGYPNQYAQDQQPVWDPASGSYTFAGATRSPDLKPTAEPVEDGFDLENALEALDVDLDELGGVTPVPLAVPKQRAPARPPRAVSEDGIEIDFDDE